jgi:DNA (cytosine-5)-methyltransferase 1
MKHGSLFSGIGGFDLAAEWMGWENVFHCEWMEFPRKVLDYHFPDADSHIDICTTDFKKYANKIDILTGGFPCQPFSLAGKRKGTDDERYLWGEMLRAIQEIKPKYIIAENVFGITNIDGGLVFQQVCIDLENQGYEVQAFIVPACAKNAPHRRDRVWFIAYTKSKRSRGLLIGKKQTHPFNGIIGSNGDATDTNCTNNQTRSHGKILGQSHRQKTDGHSNVERTNQWENFPTQSPVCSGDDGIPTQLDGITFSKWRKESIKGYGNAIVPQIAYSLFEIIQELNENN